MEIKILPVILRKTMNELHLTINILLSHQDQASEDPVNKTNEALNGPNYRRTFRIGSNSIKCEVYQGLERLSKKSRSQQLLTSLAWSQFDNR